MYHNMSIMLRLLIELFRLTGKFIEHYTCCSVVQHENNCIMFNSCHWSLMGTRENYFARNIIKLFCLLFDDHKAF